MEQRRYMEGIKMLRRENYTRDRKLEANENTLYKLIVRKLNWTVQHTKTNLAYGENVASQIGREKSSRVMRSLFMMVWRAKENHLEVRMERLRGEVDIETYTDTPIHNFKEGRSQVGFIDGIRDEWGRKCLIYWK